jgi:hypothetical protein
MGIFDGLKGTFGGAFSGSFATTKGIATALFWGMLIFVAIGIIGWYFWKKYQELTFYTTPINLTILMENGMEKTRFDLKGGAFWNKGIRDFKIKIPKQRKPHILGYIPDFSKSGYTDGRLHFITSGDRTIWQQVESGWILNEKRTDKEGNIFKYDLFMKPIPREIKQITINSIKNWRDTVDKSKLTAFGIAIGAFIIMVIAHLVSLYIQTRIRCPAPVV